MVKQAKTSHKKKAEIKTSKTVTISQMIDAKLVSETLLYCIRTEDLDSFRSVLTSCLTVVNKTHLAKKAGIGRQTLYDLINPERGFNPELSTVAAIIRALAHEGECLHV